MSTEQVSQNSNKTEAPFVVDLKRMPKQELLLFISSPWTASILSPEEIEEIYQYILQMAVTSPVETEENFIEIGLD